MRERQGSPAGADPHCPSPADDIEYYTMRSCKQIELAAKADSDPARDAHLKLADLFGEKARTAMAIAMRTNAPSADVRAAAFLRLDELSLDDLLGPEKAEKFRNLRLD